MNSTLKILLIGEYPPPFAGIGVQTKHLYELFLNNNIHVNLLSLTQNQSGKFSFINNIRFLRGGINLIQYFINLIKIRKSNIVHILASSGLNFYIFSIPALFVSKLLRKKTIIHYHGGGAHDFFRNKRWLLKSSNLFIDKLVVPSGFLQDVFSKFGYTSTIIPNAINLTTFKFELRTEIRPNILSVRNFTSLYNISCAIRAFKVLHTDIPEARMIIAGDGVEKDKLISLAKELELDKAIEFVGNIPNDMMASLYKKSDILINTSNIDNMPVSILEAQAMGLVVVTTDPGGIPYIIENKINGFTTDINNDKKLGKHLITAVRNQELSISMIVEGRKSISNMDSLKVLQQWIHLYNSI